MKNGQELEEIGVDFVDIVDALEDSLHSIGLCMDCCNVESYLQNNIDVEKIADLNVVEPPYSMGKNTSDILDVEI